MMIVVQCIIVFFHMCIAPFLIGCIIFTGREKAEKAGVTGRMVAGLIVSYGLYEGMTMILQVLGKGFRLLSGMYLIAILLLSGIGFFRLLKNHGREKLFVYKKPDRYMVAAILLVAVQIGAILLMATPDKDDAFYSGLSSMSLTYDYLLEVHAYSGQMNQAISSRYMYSALPVYQASLSLFSGGLHPLVITHNLFPLFYMPLAYAMYYRIGARFLEKEGIRKASGKFLFCFAILHMIGNYYVFSPENFLVTRIWQGKALFVAIAVPFLWYYGELALSCSHGVTEVGKGEKWKYWLLLACGLVASTFMGSTGLYLAPIMLAGQTISTCLVYKKCRGIFPAILCCIPEIILLMWIIWG